MAEISMYDPSMLVWIDETGCDQRNTRRRYGYSIRGTPPCDHRLLVRGTRYSAIPMMSVQGIHGVQVVEGTVNGLYYKTTAYFKCVLLLGHIVAAFIFVTSSNCHGYVRHSGYVH